MDFLFTLYGLLIWAVVIVVIVKIVRKFIDKIGNKNKELRALKAQYDRIKTQLGDRDRNLSDQEIVSLVHSLADQVLQDAPFSKHDHFDPPNSLVDAIRYTIGDNFLDSVLVKLPKIDFSKPLPFNQIFEHTRTLKEKEMVLSDFDRYVKSWRFAVRLVLNQITNNIPYIPPSPGYGIEFQTYLYEYVNDLPQALEMAGSCAVVEDDSVPQIQHKGIMRKLDNAYMSAVKAQNDILPPDKKNAQLSPTELIHTYFANTAIEQLLLAPVPFHVPFKKRFEHTHIVAGSGHGKTQLLQSLIFNDLCKAAIDTTATGLCVIDSQGDLISLLSHLMHFDPTVEGNISDRLIIIDPTDTEYPVCLNLFDLNLEKIADPIHREMVINSTISLYQYIFSDLVEGKLTMYQENIFQNCAKLLLTIKGATFLTFIDLLTDISPFKPHIDKLDPTARQFFEHEFNTALYKSTKQQLLARLRRIATNTTFRRMFANERSTVDMLEAMSAGKIVLINTSKMLLQSDGAKMLGKFFITLILQSVFQRAFIPESKRPPFLVYIDEAQDYLSDTLAEFFEQARKYNVGLTIAHQYLKQFDQVSTALKHSVLANTAIKLVGNTIPEDARTMAERMFTGKDEILNLKKRDREYSEFLCFIKDSTRSALKLQVPLGVVNEKAFLDDKKYSLLIEQNRAQYCRPANKAKPQDAGEPITSPPQPDQEAPEPAPAQDQAEDFQKFKIGKRKAF